MTVSNDANATNDRVKVISRGDARERILSFPLWRNSLCYFSFATVPLGERSRFNFVGPISFRGKELSFIEEIAAICINVARRSFRLEIPCILLYCLKWNFSCFNVWSDSILSAPLKTRFEYKCESSLFDLTIFRFKFLQNWLSLFPLCGILTRLRKNPPSSI